MPAVAPHSISASPRAADEPVAPPLFDSAPAKFNRTDYLALALIGIVTLLLNAYGLGALEFFRHTEADRTLIAWEMVEDHSYLVPKLIGSVILTKPPLFYWTLAGTIELFGYVSEAVVRLPSVIISVLFALMQFIAVRKSGGNRSFALLSVAMLVTSIGFFLLATAAEIDMQFGFLCMLSFYLAYFATIRVSLTFTVLAYIAAGIAFLAKGPPIVAFLGAGHLIFYLVEGRKRGLAIPRFILWNMLGSSIFLLVVMSWLAGISSQVGWAELERQFHVEVFERFMSETHHPHNALYYLGVLAGNLAPWTPFLVAGLAVVFFPKYFPKEELVTKQPSTRPFYLFNAIFLIATTIMLSIADGKSNRYIFPVHACAINLTALYFYELKGTRFVNWLRTIGFGLGGLLLIATPIAAFTLNLEGVARRDLIITSIVLLIPLGMLTDYCWKSRYSRAVVSLFLIMCGVRVALTLVFAPHRNATRSVKPIAADINATLPQGATLYNVELFERWITYYLKHLGRKTLRLTPAASRNPAQTGGKSYVLLNSEEEAWRMDDLKAGDPHVKIIKEYDQARDHFLLVEVDPTALARLEPHSYFPTVPSPPYYNHPEHQGVAKPRDSD